MMRLLLAALAVLFVTPAQAAIESPLPDLVCESTNTSGTGTVTLTGAATGGYVTFASQVTSSNTVYYNIVTGTGPSRKVEVGEGVFTSPSTLTRVAAWSSDGAGAELILAGTSTVCAGISGGFFALGAGSGLNADLLDGISSGAFATSAGTAIDITAGTVSCNLGDVTTRGCLELATTAEAETGTDTVRAVTAAGITAAGTGKRTIPVMATGMKANVTNPAACGDVYDSGTNDLSAFVCAFDAGATEERADFQVPMPKSWNEGTFTYQAMVTCVTCSAAQTIQFELSCVAISHDDTLNATMGTAQTSATTVTAINDLHTTAESSAITCAGTPAEGDLVAFRVSRDTSVDNATGDALLIAIKLYWTNNAITDD